MSVTRTTRIESKTMSYDLTVNYTAGRLAWKGDWNSQDEYQEDTLNSVEYKGIDVTKFILTGYSAEELIEKAKS